MKLSFFMIEITYMIEVRGVSFCVTTIAHMSNYNLEVLYFCHFEEKTKTQGRNVSGNGFNF